MEEIKFIKTHSFGRLSVSLIEIFVDGCSVGTDLFWWDDDPPDPSNDNLPVEYEIAA